MSIAREDEFQAKVKRVRKVIRELDLDGIYLKKQSSFSWLSCGGSAHVSLASTLASGGLFVTGKKVYLNANRIESPRLRDEEMDGLPVEYLSYDWFTPEEELQVLHRISGKGKIGCDLELPGTVPVARKTDPLRYSLLPAEIRRYMGLGRDAEEALRTVCKSLEQGVTEYEVAGRVAEACYGLRIQPLLTLVAGDNRIDRYRHPIPTAKRCQGRLMVALCGRRQGLIVSFTRFVSFRPLTPVLLRRVESVARVDATLILNSRPGMAYGKVLETGIRAYEREGYRDEWHLHHQGGPTGYEAREFKAAPDTAATVLENQAIAWNPSITGTKSEDTVLVDRNGPTVVTEAREWPMIPMEIPEGGIARPGVLEK